MQVANMIKFDGNTQRPLCLACEEMLVDAVDETLTPADQAFFDRHVSTCSDCTQMLADARRGAAWLELLKTPRPEPSAMLMERILSQTSGLTSGHAHEFAPVIVGQPAILPTPVPSNVLAFRPRMPKFASWTNARFEPRLAMTAAMAFFSIALTLNLTGVRLDQLNASSLSPSSVKRTYYEASAGAVRYYDNLRVVRVMESRVDNVRQANSGGDEDRDQTQPATQPKSEPSQPEKQQKKPSGGVSSNQSPIDRPRFLITDEKIARRQTAPGKTTKEGGLA